MPLLIVSNPCLIETGQYFCKETGESEILYKAIIQEFTKYDELSYIATANIIQGRYSLTINYISSGGLQRECWDNSLASGVPIVSDTSTFDIPVDTIVNSCRFEGFFRAPENEIEFSVSAYDIAHVWVEDYSNIRFISTSNDEKFYMNLIKDKLYYIRVETFNTVDSNHFTLYWRLKGSTSSFSSFTIDMLYNPKRPVWDTLQISSWRDALSISSNDGDYDLYYCPYHCSSCTIGLDGSYECHGCRVNFILREGKCTCEVGFTLDIYDLVCRKCPDLSKDCEFIKGELKHVTCQENAILFENSCYCDQNYYGEIDSCNMPECSLNLSFINTNSKDVLVDLVEDCGIKDTNLCSSSFLKRSIMYEEFDSDIRILGDKEYYLSILSLEQGGLSFQYYSSNNYNSYPTISSKESLESDLSLFTTGVARFEGYIKFIYSGVITFFIDSNTLYTIYIQDDRNFMYEYTAQSFTGIFTENRFYFIRIDLTITTNTYINIFLYGNEFSYQLTYQDFYYYTRSEDSPIYIDSCNMNYSFILNDEATGIKLCPNLCSSCIQKLTHQYDETDKDPICTGCIESASPESDSCTCKNYSTFSSYSERCEINSCSKYDTNFDCVECTDNYTLKQGVCICDTEDFQENGDTCIPKEFKLEIISSTNELQLIFSKSLLRDLKDNDISLSIQDSDITEGLNYEFITRIPKKVYHYKFVYPENIDKLINIQLILSENIKDRQNTSLLTYYYKKVTHIFFEYPYSQDNSHEEGSDSLVSSLKGSSQIFLIVTCSVTLIPSLLRNSPDNFLLYLNTLQIFQFLPLLNIDLPPRVLGICLGINLFQLLPNLFDYFLDDTEMKLNDRFLEYGYNTCQFLLNGGEQISVFIETILIYIILKLIYKLCENRVSESKIKLVLGKIIGMYEYGVFIGYIIQAYLELLITSGLNVVYPRVYSGQMITSLVLSIIFPLLLASFLFKYSTNFSDELFSRKFGVLYSLYDVSKEYYFINILYFYIRRLIYGVSILILGHSPYSQVYINSATSAGIIIFLIFNNNYRTAKDRYLDIFVESCIFITMSCLGFQLIDALKDAMALDWFISIILYSSIGIPFSVNLLASLKELYYKYRPRNDEVAKDPTSITAFSNIRKQTSRSLNL